MEEDLVKQLEVFGLSTNQAKVYLVVLQAGAIPVGKIAEATKVYRQDIYKILPTLEKKGVITRTLGTPVIVKAIPVRKALKNLVAMEKKRVLEKIIRMETSLKEISNALSLLHETEMATENQEPSFSLLTEDTEVTNRADMLYEKAKIECDFVASLEVLSKRIADFQRRFRNAVNNEAKIRLIVEAPKSDERIRQVVESVRPNTKNFEAKFVVSKSPNLFKYSTAKKFGFLHPRNGRNLGFHVYFGLTAETWLMPIKNALRDSGIGKMRCRLFLRKMPKPMLERA
jgi:sugar-specific transcriptional regulator TrmB